MKLMIATTMATALTLTPLLAANDNPAEQLDEAAAAFSEIMATPDKGIPRDLLAKAHCIVIVPGLKTAAFIVGAKYGKGYLSCRNKSGAGWSAPGTVKIEGGSVGFQIGGSSTDLIMLVMTARGADKLLASEFTLGAEASVAAGPVGRTATAQTADILSWSRSEGLFAGVALEGATLRQDLDDNAELYGKELQNRDIVTKGVPAPKAAAKLLALLNQVLRQRTQELSERKSSTPARNGWRGTAIPICQDLATRRVVLVVARPRLLTKRARGFVIRGISTRGATLESCSAEACAKVHLRVSSHLRA